MEHHKIPQNLILLRRNDDHDTVFSAQDLTVFNSVIVSVLQSKLIQQYNAQLYLKDPTKLDISVQTRP